VPDGPQIGGQRMGLFSHKTDPLDGLDPKTIDRSHPHPYMPHMDAAHRDHTSCSVCGQEKDDVLHIALADYLAAKAAPKAEPTSLSEIRW
jgi:hypothetical protein